MSKQKLAKKKPLTFLVGVTFIAIILVSCIGLIGLNVISRPIYFEKYNTGIGYSLVYCDKDVVFTYRAMEEQPGSLFKDFPIAPMNVEVRIFDGPNELVTKEKYTGGLLLLKVPNPHKDATYRTEIIVTPYWGFGYDVVSEQSRDIQVKSEVCNN